MTKPQTANPFGQEPLQQLLMIIGRELHENLQRNGWQEQEAFGFVVKTVEDGMNARRP